MLQERHLNFGETFERAASGLLLPAAVAPPPSRPIAVDLFAGAGGFSLGFHQAGWHVAAAAEGWATAACTYLVNLGEVGTVVHLIGDELPEGNKKERAFYDAHKGSAVPAEEFLEGVGCSMAAGSGWIAHQEDEPACEHYYLGDIRALTGHRLREDLGVDVGAVIGGPPCQGFSLAGQRNIMDPRNSLVFDFMRIVCELKPQTFVMENVPGIASMLTAEGVPVIDAIAQIAEDGGFGTYDAIRRSLLSHPDARAAMRSKPVGRAKDKDGSRRGARGMPLDGRDRFDDEDAVEDQQLAMELA